MLRIALFGVAVAALAGTPSVAQAPRPAGRPAPKAAAPQPPAPPPIFPCRTAEEVCYLGIVMSGQVVVLYTNATNAQGIDEKPVDVMGADGAKIDMAKENGRVVMLTGAYDPKTGLSKAEIVEVASPLASLAVKAQLAAGAAEGGGPPGAKGGAPRRR